MMMMKKTGSKIIITSLIVGAFVFVGIRAPFIHKKYEYVNSTASPEYKTHKATYKPILKERDFALENLVKDLDSGNISKESFVIAYREFQQSSKLKLQEYSAQKKKLQNKYKYRGFNSYYIFLLNIGSPILALIIAGFFIFSIFNPIKGKYNRFIFVSIGGLFIGAAMYPILWALFAQMVFEGDFPKSWYHNILRFVPLISALLTILLFYYYKSIETNLKRVINNLIVFIVHSEKYIDKEETKTEHFKDYMGEFEKIVK